MTQASNACLCVDLICCLLTKAPQAGLSNSNGTSGERTHRAMGEKGITRPSEVQMALNPTTFDVGLCRRSRRIRGKLWERNPRYP